MRCSLIQHQLEIQSYQEPNILDTHHNLSRGAKAYVDLTIYPTDTPSTIVIEKDTQFTSTVNGVAYVFQPQHLPQST